MTVAPVVSNGAQRFPTVEAVTVEWEECHHAGETPSTGHGSFSHVMRTASGAFESMLPCLHPICQDGGFEILEVVEWMVSNRQEEKSGVLVCIGWEHTTGKPTEQSPCTRVISYRIGLAYRKSGDVRRNSATERGHDKRCDEDR